MMNENVMLAAGKGQFMVMPDGKVDRCVRNRVREGDTYVTERVDITRKEGKRIYEVLKNGGEKTKVQIDGETATFVRAIQYTSSVFDVGETVESDTWIASPNANVTNATMERFRGRPKVRVEQWTVDGEYVRTWDSIAEATVAFGFKSTASISRCAGGDPRCKTAGGFVWKKAER